MNVRTPGLLTVVDGLDFPRLRAHGYEWVSFQHWNAGARGPYYFAAARAAGLEAGVWGVLYEHEDLDATGRAMGARALELGASHLIADVEYALNNTRPGGMGPFVAGIRAGGWAGPVHLSCLGAPDGGGDYRQDLGSFLATGGGVFPQAYTNQHDGYRPDLCVAYYTGKGVPRERLNLTIWPNGSLPGSEWVKELAAAGLGRACSIFLAETTSEADFTTLEAITRMAQPVWTSKDDPAYTLDGSTVRANVGNWRQGQSPDGLTEPRYVVRWSVDGGPWTGEAPPMSSDPARHFAGEGELSLYAPRAKSVRFQVWAGTHSVYPGSYDKYEWGTGNVVTGEPYVVTVTMPAAAPAPSAADAIEAIKAAARPVIDSWQVRGLSEAAIDRQRVGLIDRIARTPADKAWYANVDRLNAILDELGAA